jgi:hypothetical protein
MTYQPFLRSGNRRSTAVFRHFACKAMPGWWDGVCLAASIAAFAATVGCFGACAQEQPHPGTVACSGEIIARGTVSRLIDGRGFVLDDGREVRLAAIEVPPLPPPQESGSAPTRQGIKRKNARVNGTFASWLRSHSFRPASSRRSSMRPPPADLTVAGLAEALPYSRAEQEQRDPAAFPRPGCKSLPGMLE